MALPSTLEELVKSFKENTQSVAETEEESVVPLYKLAFSGSLINSMATGVSSASVDSCPQTFTQLFKSLLLEFLLRQTDLNSATQIQEFGDLPPAVLPSLKKVCRFAYNNVKKSMYVFNSDELELDNDLGLVQPVKIGNLWSKSHVFLPTSVSSGVPSCTLSCRLVKQTAGGGR